ncbi:MAG: hypothetical protein LBQ69_03155 [Treponema sp.]|jgi:hypothetical protein|nr:hypothetical protein [Treponema sp.]
MGAKFPVFIALLALSCAGCAKAAKDTATATDGADAVSAATAAKGPSPRELLEGFMPGAMAQAKISFSWIAPKPTAES